MEDKTTFIVDITAKFLLCSPKEAALYNQKNVIEFINSQKQIDMDQFLLKIVPSLG